MNWLDILIIVGTGISVAIGIMRGFIRECFSLGSYITGYLVATSTYTIFSRHLTGIINSPQGRKVIAFAFIFIIVVIMVNLTGRYVRKLISMAKVLSMADRLIGLVFGFCRAVLILALIMIPVSLFPVIGSNSLKNSSLASYLLVVSKNLSTWAFSEKKGAKKINVRGRIEVFKKNLNDSVSSIRKSTQGTKGSGGGKGAKEAVSQLLGNDGDKKKNPSISENDRKKLNQLLDQL